MAIKTYTSTSQNFCVCTSGETKTDHASGHPSRKQIVPGTCACFVGGKFTTGDAAMQTKLDALVTAKQLT